MDIKNEIPTNRTLLLFFILQLLSAPASAGIFKCLTPSGKTLYQQGPCNPATAHQSIQGTLNVAPVQTRAEIEKKLSQGKRKFKRDRKNSRKQKTTTDGESVYAKRMRLKNSTVKGNVIEGMSRKQVARALRHMKKTGDSSRKNYDSETYTDNKGSRATVRYDKAGFVEAYDSRKANR